MVALIGCLLERGAASYETRMIEMVSRVRGWVGQVSAFMQRQKHNYRVGVARSAANSFLVGITNQYNAIYAVGLGADSVQLGSLSSIGGIISMLISIPVGWLVDRRGIRVFFTVGIGLSAVAALIYAIAGDWRFLIVAAALVAISARFTGTSSSVVCADSVANSDRATAQNVCATLSGVLAMAAPLLAAYLITRFGGMNVPGIRPLYWVQAVGYGLILVFVAARLREPLRMGQRRTSSWRGLGGDFRQLFVGRPLLRRWIIISALSSLPMAMF